jgi:hypothetical protein
MLMRPAGLTLAMISLVLGSSASAKEPVKWTQAMNLGFHGPVHSERTISRKLNPDPRTDPRLFIFPSAPWEVFDPAGRPIEESISQEEDGRLSQLARTSYEPEAWVKSYDNSDSFRIETKKNPAGTVETKTFRNDQLVTRHIRRFNDQGDMLESLSYNSTGELVNRATYAYENGRLTEHQVRGRKGEFYVHMADRYNQDGDLILRIYYDKEGNPVTMFSLDGLKLTSYWQDPNCECSNEVGLGTDGVSYSYRTERDGGLETIVENHSGVEGNLEPTDSERFSGNHVLVEKLTFTYERDAHGNWTKRVVSAWDPNSGIMIPIQEDLRTVTYY